MYSQRCPGLRPSLQIIQRAIRLGSTDNLAVILLVFPAAPEHSDHPLAPIVGSASEKYSLIAEFGRSSLQAASELAGASRISGSLREDMKTVFNKQQPPTKGQCLDAIGDDQDESTGMASAGSECALPKEGEPDRAGLFRRPSATVVDVARIEEQRASRKFSRSQTVPSSCSPLWEQGSGSDETGASRILARTWGRSDAAQDTVLSEAQRAINSYRELEKGLEAKRETIKVQQLAVSYHVNAMEETLA